MKLVGKKEFVTIAFDLDDKILVVYPAFFTSSNIYSSSETYIALLKANEISTAILLEYVNFANNFSLNLKAKYLEHTKIFDGANNLIDSKQPFYKPTRFMV